MEERGVETLRSFFLLTPGILLFLNFTVYPSEATQNMKPEDLQEIIIRIRNGDRAAFRILVEMYRQQAYRMAFRILGNEEEARDIVQDSFVKIWQKIGSYDPSRKFVTWMNGIVVHASVDRLRVLRRHVMVPIDLVSQTIEALQQRDPGRATDDRDLALMIQFLAEGLPEKQKLIFILRDIEGMPSEEVEAVTGLPEDSVKSNLCHARKSVRKKLFMILEKERAVK
jgi:RNA polymerase sigma-70 factor (ECF subfamily)